MEPPDRHGRPAHPRREGEAAQGRRTSRPPTRRSTSRSGASTRRGWSTARPVPGYREEDGRGPRQRDRDLRGPAPRVDNWRWAGVPIYVRTGKRLPARVTEVALQFHSVPYLAFEGELARQLRPNALVLRIQPDEGISLHFGAKVPGEAFRVQSVAMDFTTTRPSPDPGDRRLPAAAPRRHDAATPPCSSAPTRWNRPGGSSTPTSRPGPSPAAACTSTRPAPGAPTSPTSCSSAPATSWRVPELDPSRLTSAPDGRDAGATTSPAAFADPWPRPFAERPGPALLPGALGRPDAPGPATSGWPPWPRRTVDWRLVDVYMGDERLVPPDDPDANQRLVREALLDPVGGGGVLHPMPTEGDPDARAAATTRRSSAAVLAGPGIDLVHLGLGPDGHTASLFPGAPTLEARPDRLVAATEDPERRQPPPPADPDPPGHRPGPAGRLHGARAPTKREAVAAPAWPATTSPPPGCGARGPLARRRRRPSAVPARDHHRRRPAEPARPGPTGRAGRPRPAAACGTGPTGNRVTYSPKVFIPLTMLCRDRCGYCTFAKAPARLASPYLSPRRGAGHRPGRGATPAATRPSSPWASGPSSATRRPPRLAGRPRLRLDRRLPGRRCARAVLEETGLLPHANAGALYDDELAAAAAGDGQPGDDDRDPGRGPGRPPAGPRQGARAPPGHPGGGRPPGHPLHHRDPGRHRRDPGRPARRPWWPSPSRHRTPRPRPGGHRPELPAQAGHGHGRPPAVPARGAGVVDRRRPARCCPPTSTSRPRPTSPTTWPRCSRRASTTGAACRR